MSLVGVFVVIMIMLFIILGIIALFVTLGKNNVPIPPNSPLIVKFGHNNSSGYALGVLMSMNSENFSDRLSITMKPLDLGYKGKRPILSGPIEFTVRKEQLKINPTGTASTRRDIYFISPNSSVDLNEGFRNTDLGNAICQFTENNIKKDNAIETVKKRNMTERSDLTLLEAEKSKIDKAKDELIEKLSQNGERGPRPTLDGEQ